jgi:Fe2+ transport system protein FeoA
VDRCVVHRLLELGLTPGVELRVVQDNGGPMLVSVRGSRVALGRDLADNLWVEMNTKSDELRVTSDEFRSRILPGND